MDRRVGREAGQQHHRTIGFHTAVRDELIRRNPCDRVRRPASDTPEAVPHSRENVRALLESASTEMRALSVTLAYTGMRPGEVLALRWEDLDLEAKALRVSGTLARTDAGLESLPPKTAKSRWTIPLADLVVDELRGHRRTQDEARLAAGSAWRDSGLVFCTAIGTPHDHRNVLGRYRKISHPLGIKEGLYGFRHAVATVLFGAAEPVPTVAGVLGHARSSITVDTYGHVLPNTTAKAIGRLAAVYSADAGN